MLKKFPPAPLIKSRLWLLFFLIGSLIGASTATAQVLPVPLAPTGRYKVGSKDLHLIDRRRPEVLTEDPNDQRELYVRVWYPAEAVAENARPLPIFGTHTSEIAKALTPALKMPSGTLDFLTAVPSHSYADVPIASGKKFPVIIFSHGYFRGFASQNAVQMEELASRGYVVFAVGHTYETIVSVLPGGRVVPAGVPTLAQHNPKADELAAKIKAATDSRARAEFRRQLLLLEPFDGRLRVWTADLRFVLDEAEKMNSGHGGFFSNRLDMSRVGVAGMSFGGAAAGQFCLEDSRCRAGLNMDGTQFGDVYGSGLKRPFMFMNGGPTEDAVNKDIFNAAKKDAYWLEVKDAGHHNFTNINLLSGLKSSELTLGKVQPSRMEKILSTYIPALFDRYLRNIDSKLLAGNSTDFPEVIISAKPSK